MSGMTRRYRVHPNPVSATFATCPFMFLAAFLAMFLATGTDPARAVSSDKTRIRTVDFRNFMWDLGDGVQIETVKGVANAGSEEVGDLIHFEVLDVDHGDLDGDGIEEAIVTTLENTGGTGQFTDAVVFRYTGNGPVRVTSHGVGDRADGGIHAVVIINGVAQIERYTKGQGACCPTVISTYFVRLKGNKLITAKPPTTRATMYLGSGGDAATTKIGFLKGTSTANMSGSAGERAGGYFDARQGQTVTLRVLNTDRGSLAGAARLMRNSALLLQVKQGATGSFKLPATGRYRVELMQTQAGNGPDSFSWVELEFSIN